MCGIAGYVSKFGNLLPDSTILDLTHHINHRGPDDEGFLFLTHDREFVTAGGIGTPQEVWETETEYRPVSHINDRYNKFSRMAFGHKRLSILDLTPAGHQPMSYRSGSYWIIFNGEIYNYEELRIELEKLNHHIKTKSDTEIILAAYSEWGGACLDKFVGMWSFAIYDTSRNEIFLARDRYGIKPLYYYFSEKGDFYFASEIKQFTAIKGWQSRINPQRVYDQLVYSFTDHTDETMFANVFQIPGGCYLKSSLNELSPQPDGKLKYSRWYKVHRDPFNGSFSEAASIFRSLFKRSVREHLHADVTVGTALSGGLDSSSIVCEVNRILMSTGSAEHQMTFSSCAEDERYNEKKWMDIVTKQTKVNASYVYPNLNDVFNLTTDLIWYHDEPYQSQSALLAYKVFKMASNKGVKVLLNGQGADEYMGGYGQFTASRYASMIKYFRISSFLSDLRNTRRLSGAKYSSLILPTIFHLTPSCMRRGISNIKSGSDRAKSLINISRLNATATHPYTSIPVEYKTVPEVSEHLTFYSTLPKYLKWEDRNSMANSVEARVPFLDHRLVEFAYSLPDDYLEKDGVSKRVMRQAMNGLIPPEIKDRKDKMGYATPEENWVKIQAPKIFKNKLSEAIDASDGIIKPEALRYFDDVVKEKIPFDYTYWRLILFSEWMQRFQVKF